MPEPIELARLLLVLDLDETLVHATESQLMRACDFLCGPYYVYKRPHLDSFLAQISISCDLAVWSAGSDDYVQPTVARLFRDHVRPLFVWSRARCTSRFDGERHEQYVVKDLAKIKRRGFSLSRTLIVDDDPRKVSRHYGNAIYIPEFLGDETDCELPRLARFIQALVTCPNVRQIEKRGWRHQRQ
jgi:TFIIF-interacting CTD phosphatase-like protein